MMSPNGLLSNATIDLCGKSGARSDALLKNAAILYEKVYFYTGFWGNAQGLNYTNTEILASWTKLEQNQQIALAKDQRFKDLFPAAEELSGFSSFSPYHTEDFVFASQQIQDNLRLSTKSIMARAYGVADEDIEKGKLGNTWELIPRYVAQDYALLSLVSNKHHHINGLFTAFHSSIYDLDDYNHDKTQGEQVFFAEDNGDECTFPDFSLLTWNEIFDLRNDPSIKSFRNKIFESSSTISEPNTINRSILERDYLQELEEFYKMREPKPLTSIMKGVAGNLPLGIPNPFSYIFATVDIKNNIRDYKKFSWLHFVHQIKQTTANRK